MRPHPDLIENFDEVRMRGFLSKKKNIRLNDHRQRFLKTDEGNFKMTETRDEAKKSLTSK
jgi:hypothetical protein